MAAFLASQQGNVNGGQMPIQVPQPGNRGMGGNNSQNGIPISNLNTGSSLSVPGPGPGSSQNNTNAIIQNFQRLQGKHSAAIDQQRYQGQIQGQSQGQGQGQGVVGTGIGMGNMGGAINPQAMNIHSQQQGLNLMSQGMGQTGNGNGNGNQQGQGQGQGMQMGQIGVGIGGIQPDEEHRRNMLEQM